MATMGMHVHAQIILMWTGFLRLEILVKKKHMKGSSHESIMPYIMSKGCEDQIYFIVGFSYAQLL